MERGKARDKFMRKWFWCVLLVYGITAFATPSMGEPWEPATAVFEYREPADDETGESHASTIIGDRTTYIAEHKDTLLDVARRNHLGYTELMLANPGVDPWLPGKGTQVAIPSQWILPDAPREGIVLNIPEMRLYYYLPDSTVMTFPLGVGVEGQHTPAGKYRIRQKRENPTWYVPVSIQKERGPDQPKVVPPGPDNPLGKYWMRLDHTSYGIHGTNHPWAIGRRVTHGCIRLYPEDIAYLYSMVPEGTPARVLYQHAKVGVMNGKAYFQVYRYGRATDSELMAILIGRIAKLKLDVDLRKLRELLLDLPDGAMTPLPPRETKPLMADTAAGTAS